MDEDEDKEGDEDDDEDDEQNDTNESREFKSKRGLKNFVTLYKLATPPQSSPPPVAGPSNPRTRTAQLMARHALNRMSWK